MSKTTMPATNRARGVTRTTPTNGAPAETAPATTSPATNRASAEQAMAAPTRSTGDSPLAFVQRQEMKARQRLAIGGGLLVAKVLLLTQLLAIWPAVVAATSTADPPSAIPQTALLFGFEHATFTADVALISMVLIVGAIGALVGVGRRFMYYASRDQLTARDQWSYLMRPFQGAMLALIVYFTLRGGFLGQDPSAPVNPYGVAALSALVGLFTRHAVSKLTEVFDTLFGKPKDDQNIEVLDRDGVQPTTPQVGQMINSERQTER